MWENAVEPDRPNAAYALYYYYYYYYYCLCKLYVVV